MAESKPRMNTTGHGQPSHSGSDAPKSTLPLLLQRVRDASIQAAEGLLKAALDAADDSLFGFSEKADNAAESARYMDAMREMRVKRPSLEQAFRERLERDFVAFVRQTPTTAVVEKAPITFAADSLSLVEDQALEEDLAIAGMVSKANLRHNSALFALTQRLGAALGRSSIETDACPLAPASVGHALRDVAARIEADIGTKLVVLKLFDRHVATDLDQVYDVANKLLAEAGVLPNVRYTRPPRLPGSSAPVARATVAGGDPAATDPNRDAAPGTEIGDAGANGEADAGTNEVIAAFASLLATRREQITGAARPVVAGPRVSNSELIAALSRMQLSQPSLSAAATDAIALVERVEQVKQDLLGQLRATGIDNPDQRVAEADEDAIDLVSMLFQFVVQDRNLPAEIQAALSRLQIPYVRVAIKDKRLFAQSQHPARRLLDTLATACIGWSKDADRDARFLDRLNQLVERVIKEYTDDVRLFDELRAEFDEFVEQQQRHSTTAEQRAAEAIKGREKLSFARRTVTQLVNERLARHQLPPLAREVVVNPWSNYLVLMHLRHGPESSEWKSAVSFVDAAAWCSQPKRNEAEYAKLNAVVPQMQAFLRRGLGVVGFGEQESQRLAHGFGAVLLSMHQREVTLEHADTIAAAEQSLNNAPPAPAAAPEAEPETADSALPEDDEIVQRVRNLKVGTWVEFSTESGTPERAKVSWISPLSARLLFVNRKGLKVAEFSVFALAGELRAGTAQILEVAPIFERALSSIMNRLKYEHLLAGGGKSDSAQQSA